MSADDYKAWYDEAMVASNEAGFAGMSAAETIRYLDQECTRMRARVEELQSALGGLVMFTNPRPGNAVALNNALRVLEGK